MQGDCEMLATVNALYSSPEDCSETITMSSYNSFENQGGISDSGSDTDTLIPPKKRMRSN